MNCLRMANQSNFKGPHHHGASPAKRPRRGSKALASGTLFDHWPYLRQSLKDISATRPEAVLRARMLIADPGWPPEDMLPVMARELAVQLTADNDSLPT
jgi:hypothetical protein